MRRNIACSLVCVIVAFGAAHAIPARPLYQPGTTAPRIAAGFNVQGTGWDGQYNNAACVFVFNADSTLTCRIFGKGKDLVLNNCGTWKQVGNSLAFDFI